MLSCKAMGRAGLAQRKHDLKSVHSVKVMCKFILPPPPQIPFLPLIETCSGKCLSHSWFHLGLQKARHKNPMSKGANRKILKSNVSWKQVPEMNVKLYHANLAIRIMFRCCLYSDLLQKLLGQQKHRSKGTSFSLGSSKGLLFYPLFQHPRPYCVKGWLVWHMVDILLFRFQMFTKQSCTEKARAFRGREPWGREVHEYIWIIN